jgi:TRAP-type C4-dicarboxylate transport system substrate-binding protein
MIRFVTCCLALLSLIVPVNSNADSIALKLSSFTSDQSLAYIAAIKPFVDAVNDHGGNRLHIDVYLSGTLGRVQSELPQNVLDGKADIAFIIPGQNPERFGNTAVIGMPGLFRDAREASLVYTRLVAAQALQGYGDFYVIGAYATAPETIHSRSRLMSLADLKDKKIRVNSPIQAEGLAKLGALATVLAFNETTPALSRGSIDGATVPAAQLFDVGIGRLTVSHYLLQTSSAALALLMNRQVFDDLPADLQDLIRTYSGEWVAERWAAVYDDSNRREIEKLTADPRRVVVTPSAMDMNFAGEAFESVRENWVDQHPHDAGLMARAQHEVLALRHAKQTMGLK